MKKLLYLFLAITVACSSGDDSTTPDNNDPQTFFEKYDSVVWEEEEDYEDYINRIQFNNGTSVSFNYYTVEEDYIDCGVALLDSAGELIEENENSFVLFNEDFEGDTNYSYTITVSAIDGGSKLTAVNSDFPNEPVVYNRTTLSQPCD